MIIKIFPLFILSFITSCAPISQEHTQYKLVTLKENSDTVNNHSSVGDTTQGLIIPTGKMQTVRAAHTATLLKNGKVLLVGGFAGSSSLSTAEIYDPALKTFASVGLMSTARSGHTATLLPNGQVLVAGGYNGSYLSSTEVFDPQTQIFSTGHVMNTPRSGHTATVLNNGQCLFAGGVGAGWSFLQSAELYDLQTKTFTTTGSMTTARESHTATLLKKGNVLITGGHRDRRGNIKIYSSSELYDPESQKFKLIGKMSIIRHKHDAVRLADDRVLITGGSDEHDSRGAYIKAELFDPVSFSFKNANNMNITRYKHNGTSILLPNGNVLIAGGTNQAEIYQPASGKFSIVFGSMGNEALVFLRDSFLQNEQVLITGGYNENQEQSTSAWLYIYKK